MTETIDGLSMNLEQANLDKLRSVFPECFAEGRLDIDKLLSLCGEYIDNDFEIINEQIRKMTKKEGIAQACYNGSATDHKTREGMPCGDYNTERADTQILF